jgi:hypothetical protein
VSAGDPGGAPTAPSDPVAAELTITATLDDGAEERRVVLTCPADDSTAALWPGGAVVAEACAALADPEVLDALRPPPADQVCTEVYGGPEVATVTGTVAGAPVDARVDRTNGCGIARWDVLAPLLPPLAR